jgi:hypothetical protein
MNAKRKVAPLGIKLWVILPSGTMMVSSAKHLVPSAMATAGRNNINMVKPRNILFILAS